MAAVLPGSEIEENGRGGRHLAPPFNPMFKGAWATRLAAGEADAAIEETIEWFRRREAPFFFWWTGPDSTPDDLGQRLAARGMLPFERQVAELAPGIRSTDIGAPGMVADLQQMNEAVLERTPAGFTIEEVQDRAALLEFKQVMIDGYSMPPAVAEGWVEAAERVGIGRTPWQMYLGRLGGRPVATNMVMNGAGVAGLYGVAVSPEARGRGIGAAISLKPLLDARDQGYRHAVLFGTDMAVPVYERIGFRQIPVRINRFLWRNG
jgi:GNAT superfamily N-acetyltransferase